MWIKKLVKFTKISTIFTIFDLLCARPHKGLHRQVKKFIFYESQKISSIKVLQAAKVFLLSIRQTTTNTKAAPKGK